MASLNQSTAPSALELPGAPPGVIRSKEPGILWEKTVTLSPEVNTALSLIREALHPRHTKLENGLRGKILVMDKAQQEALREHFRVNPSKFGEELMAAINAENANQLTRVLERNNVLVITPSGADAILSVLSIKKIYYPDTSYLKQVYGTLDSPNSDLVAYGVSGDTIKLTGVFTIGLGPKFHGMGFNSLSGSAKAVVAMDSPDLGSRVLNEVTHIEQFTRYGSHHKLHWNIHGKGDIELISDAVSLMIKEPKFVDLIIRRYGDFERYPDTAKLVDEVIGEYLDLGGPVSIFGARKYSNDYSIYALNLDEKPDFRELLAQRFLEKARAIASQHDNWWRVER